MDNQQPRKIKLQGSTTKVVQVNEKNAHLLQDDDIVSSQEETLEHFIMG